MTKTCTVGFRMPRNCAGCGQAFVVKSGWSQAIVGMDNRIYCYGTSCEHQSSFLRSAGHHEGHVPGGVSRSLELAYR